jgi:hypothetical protein
LQELIKLDDKLGGGKKAQHKLTERLSRNLERSKKYPKQVPAGQDNRADILHEARFMEGHTGKNTDLWLKARQKIGLVGYEPVSKYDFEGVGVQDRLNSYIVSILHNPGAPQFSIKMLSKQALDAARGGGGEKEDKHPTRDFDSLHDIDLALTALRVATRFIGTWNWAIEPLDVFLTEIQFGGTEFGFTPPQQKLNFVADFIDQVLRHNSQNWDDETPFMDHMAIRTKWQGDIVQRFGRTGTGYRKFDQKQKQSTDSTQQGKSTSQKANTQGQTGFTIPPFPADLCRKYQQGTCMQQEKSCRNPFNPSQERLHLCSYWFPTEKKHCRAEGHTFTEHRANPALFK